jgi:trimethylamine:corrinoid methyltransferase-like protein
MVFSPALTVLSDRIISEARTFAKGFYLNDETVSLEEIQKVGPGGNFFTSEHTLSLLAEEQNANEIWPVLNLEQWKKQDMPQAEDELIAYASELFEKAKLKSENSMEIIAKGEEFINGLKTKT